MNFNPRTPRGARHKVDLLYFSPYRFQSTHPSRGATVHIMNDIGEIDISIHAPLAGRDLEVPRKAPLVKISIHAPLAGRDQCRLHAGCRRKDFNPRTPRGARRLQGHYGAQGAYDFNPRTPRGARRFCMVPSCSVSDFNPRTPRGARRQMSALGPSVYNFNPRTPRGARRDPYFSDRRQL